VLVVRSERSWIGPHRVVLKGHDKFYARNSAGNIPWMFQSFDPRYACGLP